ncbi:MAG: hypothetical protein WB297_02840 [Actinomycetota bacterium]
MPAEEWALAASVAFSGLASGLLWMVTLINDRMLGPVTLDIPTPFVTQGANPVHVYSGVTVTTYDGKTCYTPGTEVTGVTVTGAPTALGGDITVSGLGTGFSYIAIHLDYGWKGETGYAPFSKLDPTAIHSGVPGAPPVPATINNPYTYTFTADGLSATVHSVNVFKNDPGIGGLVLTSASGDPVAGTPVEIWLGAKKMATVQTDADGWFMWTYKYTGKAATFTVNLPTYGVSKSVTLKANGYLVVSFTV